MAIYPGYIPYTLPGVDAILLTFTVDENEVYTLGRYYAPKHPIYYKGTSKQIAKQLFLKYLKDGKDVWPFTMTLYPEVQISLRTSEFYQNIHLLFYQNIHLLMMWLLINLFKKLLGILNL